MNYENLKNEFIAYLKSNNYNPTDIAVHCNIEEKASILLHVLDLLGIKWNENSKLIINENGTERAVTRWRKDNVNTCYRINENEPDKLARSNKQFYMNRPNVEVVDFLEIFVSLKDEFSAPVSENQQGKKQKGGGLFGLKKKEKRNTQTFEPVKETQNVNDVPNVPEPSVSNEPDEDVKKTDDTEPIREFEDVYSNDTPKEEQNVTDKNDATTEKQSDNDKSVATEKPASVMVQEQNKDYHINNTAAFSSVQCMSLQIPLFKPFRIPLKPFIDRIFRFNENGQREELKADNYWVQCDAEWELSFILANLDKVEVI